jgi:sulfite reductase alpha subunit-like flavoprotein
MRRGVCSNFLDQLSINGRCATFLQPNRHFRLPPDPQRAVIMVGPGTGVAPFRAFLEELASLRREMASAGNGKEIISGKETLLFFGCRSNKINGGGGADARRHPDVDFLYADELQAFEASGDVTLHVAFSRLGTAKAYVQDLLRREAKRVWALVVGGGHLYVCGDASRMAADVHEAFVAIAEAEGELTRQQAEGFVDALMSCGRYQRDVW